MKIKDKLFLLKKNIAWLSAGAIFFIIDQLLKKISLVNQNKNIQEIIPNILSFNFTPNYNISFSLPFGGNYLSLIIILIIIALFLVAFSKKTNNNESLALNLIIIGAVSNLIDRLQYGYVVDYLDLRWFTVFNLADVMISLSTIYLIIITLKKPRD